MTKHTVSNELKEALKETINDELDTFIDDLTETAILIFKQEIEKRNGSNILKEDSTHRAE